MAACLGMNWDDLTGSLDGQGHDRERKKESRNQLKPPQTPYKSLLNEQPVSGQTMNSHKVSDQKRNSTRPAAPRGEIRMMLTSSCLPNKCTTLENIHKINAFRKVLLPRNLDPSSAVQQGWNLWHLQGGKSKRSKCMCAAAVGRAGKAFQTDFMEIS